MRQRIDCALFCPDNNDDSWLGVHDDGRLAIHELRSPNSVRGPDDLVALSMQLRRYDACMLRVTPANLGWARTALFASQHVSPTPFIAVVDQLKSGAISDLYHAGVVDFITLPYCTQELRARVLHMLDTRRTPPPEAGACRVADPPLAYPPVLPGIPDIDQSICDSILERSGAELEAYAVALAARNATDKASFRAAKGLIIARFEQAYIKASLEQYEGNIAMAARHAQKHRRAFWALMRKYGINPDGYRKPG